MRKGQATVFMILGFLLFFISLMLIAKVLLNSKNEGFLSGRGLLEDARKAVEECFRQVSSESVGLLVSRGGRIYGDNPRADFLGRDLALLYEEGLSYVPTVDVMQEDLSFYSSAHFHDCTGRILPEGIELERIQGNIAAEVGDSQVRFSMLYPLYLRDSKGSVTVQSSIAVPARLGIMQRAASQAVSNIKESDMDTDAAFESLLAPSLSVSPEFSLDFVYMPIDTPEGMTVGYEIYDEKTTVWVVKDREYSLVFGARHMTRSAG